MPLKNKKAKIGHKTVAANVNDSNVQTKAKEGSSPSTTPEGLACGKVGCISYPEGKIPALILRLVLPEATGTGKGAKRINGFYGDFGSSLRSFCEKELLPRAVSDQTLCHEQCRPFRRFICDVYSELSGEGEFFRVKVSLKVMHRGKTVMRRIFIHNWNIKKGKLMPEKAYLKMLNNS